MKAIDYLRDNCLEGALQSYGVATTMTHIEGGRREQAADVIVAAVVATERERFREMLRGLLRDLRE